MKKYLKKKNSEIEWVGEIPEHWKIQKIKYSSYVKGRIGWQGLRSDEFTDDGPYLITGTEIINGKVDWRSCYHVQRWRFEQDPYIQIKNNDLLVTKDGTIGKIAFVDNIPGPTTLNSGVIVVRPLKDFYLPRYMFWILQSEIFAQYIEYIKTGATIKHLYQETFENFVYVVPGSLEEQKTISDFLDIKTKLITEHLVKKQRLIELLQEKRQAMLNHIVTKGFNLNVRLKDSGIQWIGEIPDHWHIGRLKYYVSKIGSGITPKGGSDVYLQKGVPLIREQNVRFDGLLLDDVAYISRVTHDEMGDTKLQELDVLLNITGASLGRCTIVPKGFGEANVNQHVCIIRPKYNLDSQFLCFYLSSSSTQSFIYAVQVGASRQGLTKDDIASLSVIVPPLNEQQEIIKYLDVITSKISILIKNTKQQIKRMQEYRQSLIFTAVTGKIDVRQEVIVR